MNDAVYVVFDEQSRLGRLEVVGEKKNFGTQDSTFVWTNETTNSNGVLSIKIMEISFKSERGFI